VSTHPHPTTFFTALGPRNKHWSRAPQTLIPPLSIEQQVMSGGKGMSNTDECERESEQLQNIAVLQCELAQMKSQRRVKTWRYYAFLISVLFSTRLTLAVSAEW
jgi:hypothetical protein